MPKYIYKCAKCEGIFTTIHGMTEDQDHCELCFESGTVKRIPQIPSLKLSNNNAGQLVKEYIEDTKNELIEEKKRLKSEEYE